MAFAIDDAWLPAKLTVGPLTDEAFAQLCGEHPDVNLELSADGELIVTPLAYTLSGMRNAGIATQLGNWAGHDQRGVAVGSSGGWRLPNGARRAPDAAWIFKHRFRDLDPATLSRFWPLCPDFVIELRSQSDRLPTLREKMREWIANGAQLGWLIDPDARTVEIFRPNSEAETLVGATSLAGEGPVEGFVLELGRVWDPL
jgi:Uma2 family endonuclease